MRGSEGRTDAVFEVSDMDLAGRLGTLKVNGRKVRTPELMPVVNPNKLVSPHSVPPKELLEEFGFGMIITNSYIIGRTEELRTAALAKGLHSMLDFDGLIMTDSGTFQSFIYGGNRNEHPVPDNVETIMQLKNSE